MSGKAQTSLPIAELRGISVVYGTGAATVHAVREVSLDVFRGEVLLLMGPSGSGKSTLLQVLGCIRTASTGELIVEGKRVRGMDENARCRLRVERMGFVFQHYNLLPALRAWENVALALELRGVVPSQSEEAGRKALLRLGLKHRADAYPDELSGGEKQRVAIARALAGEPDLILADEPTAALDTTNGIAVAELLAQIAHDQQRAVVVVTHDARMTGIADRVVHLEDGAVKSIRKNLAAQTRSLREGDFDEVEDNHRGSTAGDAHRRAALAG